MSEPAIQEVIVELKLVVSPKSRVDWDQHHWEAHAAHLISLNSDYCNAVPSETDTAKLRDRCQTLESFARTVERGLGGLVKVQEDLKKALAL